MDDIDLKIIEILRQDGRIPTTQVAREIGLSEGAVRRRLDRLITDDVIKIVAVPHPMAVGYPIIARIDVEIDPPCLKETGDVIAGMDQVSYAALCVDRSQITAEILARSAEDLRRMVYDDIHELPGVRSLEVTLISKVIKRTYAADY